jgi:hypothetical protein
MQKALKERRSQLEKLAVENSKETHFYGASEKSETPLYDASKLDKMVTNINNAMFEISSVLKESNATTKVEIEVNFAELMGAIKK